MVRGHFGERLADVGIDLGPGRVSQIPRRRIILEGKLGPDDEVHDSLVDTVRPVIPQNPDIVAKLKRTAPRRDWHSPLQSLCQNELHDAAIVLSELPGKAQIPAEVGWDSLKKLKPVTCHLSLYHGPRVDLIFVVWRANDAAILVGEVAKEVGALGGPEMIGDVDLPVRQILRKTGHGTWMIGVDECCMEFSRGSRIPGSGVGRPENRKPMEQSIFPGWSRHALAAATQRKT